VKKSEICCGSEYFVAGSRNSSVRRFDGSNPRSTSCSFMSDRASRPPPMSRIAESAIWATTNAPRSSTRPIRAARLPALAASASRKLARDA